MFLPPRYRIVLVALYGYIAWQFLTLGSIVVGAGILRSIQAQLDAAALVPIGAMLLYVGVMAADRLGSMLRGAPPRF